MMEKPLQEIIIDAVLAFANMGIESTRQVEELFDALPLDRNVWQVIEPENVEAYQRDQAEAREWLGQIAKTGSVRVEAEKRIDKLLKTVNVVSQFVLKDGRFQMEQRVLVEGVQASYALGVALLLEEGEDLGDHLGKCELEDCGKFFLGHRAPGRNKQYCCQAHANKARQRRFRGKHKENDDFE